MDSGGGERGRGRAGGHDDRVPVLRPSCSPNTARARCHTREVARARLHHGSERSVEGPPGSAVARGRGQRLLRVLIDVDAEALVRRHHLRPPLHPGHLANLVRRHHPGLYGVLELVPDRLCYQLGPQSIFLVRGIGGGSRTLTCQHGVDSSRPALQGASLTSSTPIATTHTHAHAHP